MIRKNFSNALEQIILRNIQLYGWHSNSVGSDMDSAMFAYTVGFFSSFRHPELLVFGLSPQTSHGIFRAAAGSIARGRPLKNFEPNDQLLAGRHCMPVDVPGRLYEDFARSACWYYNGSGFPLFQIVWPSDDGLYPWHPSATEEFVSVQPVLSQYSAPV